MIKNFFTATVIAICQAEAELLSPDQPTSNFKPPFNNVSEFVLEEMRKMTDYLRFPLMILTCVFGVAPFFCSGKMFHQIADEKKKNQLKAWRSSWLSVKRDFIRFYESLAVLALYGRVEGSTSKSA